MKNFIKDSLKKLFLIGFARYLLHRKRSLQRKLRRLDSKLIKRYFKDEKTRKLHVGCGNNILDGWLNSDYSPISNKVLYLDATKKYPFKTGSFNYVFSEHLIEHIAYSDGLFMLQECHRVLRDNGKIRISTPDLKFLIDLYKNEKSKLQKDYIKYSTDRFIEYAPFYQDTFVINNFFRNWGHQFIYDEKTLRFLLEKAGFVNITRCNLNESTEDSLRNLENINRKPEELLKLETFTLEATKSYKNQQTSL